MTMSCIVRDNQVMHTPKQCKMEQNIYSRWLYGLEMKLNEKCNDLKCVQKPTQSRLSLTHHANKSSRWTDNTNIGNITIPSNDYLWLFGMRHAPAPPVKYALDCNAYRVSELVASVFDPNTAAAVCRYARALQPHLSFSCTSAVLH